MTIESDDLFDLNNLYFIFPHNLSPESLERQYLYLPKFSETVDKIEEFNFSLSLERGTRVFVIKQMGFLCDLYPYFDSVYIGGGFGKSIHSVLEPYVSGAQVFCGPKVYRSSEYEYIMEESPEIIKQINSMSEIIKYSKDVTINRGEKRLSKIKRFQGEHEALIEKVILYGR